MTVEIRRVQVAVTSEAVSPKVQECFGEIVGCVKSGFTGSLDFDFKDGVPTGVRKTECKRFSRKETP